MSTLFHFSVTKANKVTTVLENHAIDKRLLIHNIGTASFTVEITLSGEKGTTPTITPGTVALIEPVTGLTRNTIVVKLEPPTADGVGAGTIVFDGDIPGFSPIKNVFVLGNTVDAPPTA